MHAPNLAPAQSGYDRDGLPRRPGMWHSGSVNLWLALRRLLPLLAVLSLALTPVTAPAATAGMHASMAHGHHAAAMGNHGRAGMDDAAMVHHKAASVDMAGAGMDMDDMPCCPKAETTRPDCVKGCPLMALCLASVASLLPVTVAVPAPVGRRANPSWPLAASFASVPGTLLPEPPRA